MNRRRNRVLMAVVATMLAALFTTCESGMLGEIREVSQAAQAATETQYYTVTYDGNGADTGAVPIDTNGYPEGSVVTVLGPGTMARTDYTFDGWTFDQEGGTRRHADDTFVMGSAVRTLYAQWVPENTVLTPVFHPLPGTWDIDLNVEIGCATDGATIYYTTDGSTPGTHSHEYVSPISITGSLTGVTTTIRAYALKEHMNDSGVATGEYTIVYLNAPTGVSASSGTSTSAVIVTWSVSEAPEYEVYRNTSNAIEEASVIASSVVGSSYSDTSASAGTLYYYWVRGHNPSTGALSGYSNSDSGYRKLAVPGSFSASNGTNTSGVDLTWSPTPHATRYYLYRNTEDSIPGSSLGDTSSTTFTDTGATVGTLYYYWIRAHDDSPLQFSEYSSSTTGFTKLNVPANFTASDGTSGSHVYLSWDHVSGHTHYYVYRNEIDQIPAEPITTRTSSQRTFADTNASPGVRYYYWVRAYDNTKNHFGDPATDSGYRKISPPANLQATQGLVGKIELTWNHVAGAASYHIQRDPDPRFGGWSLTWLPEDTPNVGDTLTFTPFPHGSPGITYTFTVRSYRSSPAHYSDPATANGFQN